MVSKEQFLNQKVSVPKEHWDAMFAPSSGFVMITTVDKQGKVNSASFGTCTRVNHDPVYISFTTYPNSDTGMNLTETGEFVVNLVPFDQNVLEKAITCGLPFKHGINELEKAGLTGIPSLELKPPRIAECPVHFECKVAWVTTWHVGKSNKVINAPSELRMMVCGEVVAVSINKDCYDEEGYIIWDKVKPCHYCGAPYSNRFVPANLPMKINRVYEGSEEEMRPDSDWRYMFL